MEGGTDRAEVEEVLGLSIVCSRAARCKTEKVKSPNLVKIMSSSADVVLIQQITGLYIMSCRWRNQCRGEPGGTRFSPTGRICERCSFVPVSGSSWNLNVHVQIDGFYFTDLFFTLIPEYRKKRWGGKMWLNPVLLKHHQRQFLSLCPLLYYKCTNSNTPQHHNTCSEFIFDHKTDKTQSGSRRRSRRHFLKGQFSVNKDQMT